MQRRSLSRFVWSQMDLYMTASQSTSSLWFRLLQRNLDRNCLQETKELLLDLNNTFHWIQLNLRNIWLFRVLQTILYCRVWLKQVHSPIAARTIEFLYCRPFSLLFTGHSLCRWFHRETKNNFQGIVHQKQSWRCLFWDQI